MVIPVNLELAHVLHGVDDVRRWERHFDWFVLQVMAVQLFHCLPHRLHYPQLSPDPVLPRQRRCCPHSPPSGFFFTPPRIPFDRRKFSLGTEFTGDASGQVSTPILPAAWTGRKSEGTIFGWSGVVQGV
jgi:hypothetical protein